MVRFGLVIGLFILVILLEVAHWFIFYLIIFFVVSEGMVQEEDGCLYFMAAIVLDQVPPEIGIVI